LARLQGRIRDIDAMPEGDERNAAKRDVFDLLVHGITVHTDGEGRNKRVSLSIAYNYHPSKEAVVNGKATSASTAPPVRSPVRSRRSSTRIRCRTSGPDSLTRTRRSPPRDDAQRVRAGPCFISSDTAV